MAELTTEYLDKALDKFASKEYLNKTLDKKLSNYPTRTEMDTHFTKLYDLVSDLQIGLGQTNAKLDLFEEHVNRKFNGLETRFTLRFSFIDAELATLKRQLKEYSDRDKEDSDAIVKTITKLQKRIEVLEGQMKKLKSKQSAN